MQLNRMKRRDPAKSTISLISHEICALTSRAGHPTVAHIAKTNKSRPPDRSRRHGDANACFISYKRPIIS